VVRLGIFNKGKGLPPLLKSMAPKLTTKDRSVVESVEKLVSFMLGGAGVEDMDASPDSKDLGLASSSSSSSSSGSGSGSSSISGNGGGGGGSRNQEFQRRLLGVVEGGNRNREKLNSLLPVFREFQGPMRAFGLQIVRRLVRISTGRFLRASSDAIFTGGRVR
jgi:hypothetical protein